MFINTKNLKLIAAIFVFAAFIQGCSSTIAPSNAVAPGGTSTGDTNNGGKLTETGAEEVAVKTLLNFNQAVQKGDFQEFQQTQVAESAKAELTAQKLNTAFAEFISSKIDISPKEDAVITWAPSEMTAESLNMSGSYPGANGKKIEFSLQYLKDKNNWGLKMIDVKAS